MRGQVKAALCWRPLKIPMLTSNPQCSSSKRWGPQKVITSWGQSPSCTWIRALTTEAWRSFLPLQGHREKTSMGINPPAASSWTCQPPEPHWLCVSQAKLSCPRVRNTLRCGVPRFRSGCWLGRHCCHLLRWGEYRRSPSTAEARAGAGYSPNVLVVDFSCTLLDTKCNPVAPGRTCGILPGCSLEAPVLDGLQFWSMVLSSVWAWCGSQPEGGVEWDAGLATAMGCRWPHKMGKSVTVSAISQGRGERVLPFQFLSESDLWTSPEFLGGWWLSLIPSWKIASRGQFHGVWARDALCSEVAIGLCCDDQQD